jgi:hypothetical protein
VLTLPAAAAVGALTYGATRIFGNGSTGPVVVSIGLLLLLMYALGRRLVTGRTLTAEA